MPADWRCGTGNVVVGIIIVVILVVVGSGAVGLMANNVV